MSARDEAIESMVAATDYDLRYRLGASGVFDLLGAMLDLIPADVLIQYLFERGALVGNSLDDWWGMEDSEAPTYDTYYRLTEEGT